MLVTTHSPQIASEFRPDGVVRLLERGGSTVAASGGCSACIDEAWQNLGYRMSIVPAEALFADAVLLVEGPSEMLFYHELARQLGTDLAFHNVSILSVEGVDFEVLRRDPRRNGDSGHRRASCTDRWAQTDHLAGGS